MTNEDAKTPEEAGHEPTETGVRGILIGLAGVLAALVASMVMIFGLMAYFAMRDQPAPAVGLPETRITPGPGTPLLNAEQAGELEALRAREKQILTEYAWVDREAGVARIPIHRAMAILAKDPAGFAPAPGSSTSYETPPAGTAVP